MSEMIQHYLTNNDCYKRGKKIVPKGIMLHSTGANNPKISRYVDIGKTTNHWNRPGLTVCVHGFIGLDLDGKTVSCYQTLPLNYKGWHCGTGTKGKSANDTHISFEVCEDDLTSSSYFLAVYKKAVKVFAEICKQYHFDPMKDGVIISHAEGYKRGIASNHGDIDHWFKHYNFTMGMFRQDVYVEMQKEVEEKPVMEDEKVSQWAEESWKWCVEQGIIADNLPKFNVTKEQMCTMLFKCGKVWGLIK